MYVRGSSQDYDDWATIVDDPSWGSQSLNEYMRKSQTLEPIDDSVIERATMPFVGSNHGTSGPIRTSFNATYLPMEHDFIKACDEVCGFSEKPIDPWSGDHIGCTYSQVHGVDLIAWSHFLTPQTCLYV